MTKQQTRKDIEADREAIKAELATVREDGEKAAAEAQQALEAAEAKAEITENARAEAVGKVEALSAEIAILKESNAQLAAKVADLESAAKGHADEVNKLKAALANPAYADAQLVEAENPPAPNADAEADKAEAEAQKAAEEAAPRDIAEQYERMPQGEERTKFWKANKRAILKAIEARENEEDSDNA